MTGAGFEHRTRVMPVGAHDFYHCRIGAAQVDENVADILVAEIGLKIDIASFAVANTQKSDGAFTNCAAVNGLAGVLGCVRLAVFIDLKTRLVRLCKPRAIQRTIPWPIRPLLGVATYIALIQFAMIHSGTTNITHKELH